MSSRLYNRVVALEDRLEAFTAAPSRTTRERAVHDAWAAALKPRARRMAGRARRLADPRHWEFDEDRRPETLRAASWSLAVREFSSLYAELAGARAQYEHVRIVWTPKACFGIHRVQSASIVEGKSKDRAKAREAQKRALENARKAKMKAARKTLNGVLEALGATQTALSETLAEVRHLTAALQEIEERRLDDRVRRLSEGTREREKAEDLLLDMARGRLRAERWREQRAAGYGSLLRGEWLRPRGTLVRLLEGP